MTATVSSAGTQTGFDVLAALQPWRDAGVLNAADVHIAATLARLTGLDTDDLDVVLAVALAARAPRLGHVCLDLETVRESVPAEVEGDSGPDALAAIDELAWPEDIDAWCEAIARSPLTAADRPVPLVLEGSRLYLERYRVYESQVAEEILRRAQEPPIDLDVADERRIELLRALLGPETDAAGQWAAAMSGAAQPLAVVLGGPGTGKTRTVAALLALLVDGADGLRIALAAPTGKAAARMGETFRLTAQELRDAGIDGAEHLATRMETAEASTIHRLLGARPGSVRFRHDHDRPLVHDVVIVDETSMVSLPLMAKLLDAIRPGARVVLVGDPGQLASVEAGSVLGDIAGPSIDGASVRGPLSACISVLTQSYRFPAASPVGRFAAAVRVGDAEAALEVLVDTDASGADAAGGGVDLAWHGEGADTSAGAEVIRSAAVDAAARTVEAARHENALAALDALGEVRVLCAHRRGPFGVAHWNWQLEQWLFAGGPIPRGFYVGRPVLITANDRANRLFNGDLGVVVETEEGRRVAFPEGQDVRFFRAARLESVETVHAMTIHKSQGSEFDRVVVVLPPPESRLATRELLYTAITRARHGVTIVGTEASLRAAIGRRVVRASGLADRLWPDHL